MLDRKWLQEPGLTIISVLVTIIVLPIFTICLLPIYLIRLIVLLLSQAFKPEFKEMLTGYSTLLAVGDIFTKPTCTGISQMKLDNKLNLDKVLKVGNEVLLQEKYAKATQILVPWMGFFFWRDNPDFSLKEHFIVHEDGIKTPKDLEDLSQKLLKAPWSKQRPVWEIHLVPNFELPSKKTCTIVLFRAHHCLLDWQSMLGVLKDIHQCLNPTKKFDMNRRESYRSKRVTSGPSKILAAYLVLKHLLYGPYEFTKETITSLASAVGTYVQKKPTKEYFSFETAVPIETAKHVAKINGVKTAAVTFSAMTGALRQLMLDLGVEDLPEMVTVAIPIPVPGPRPIGLSNYFSSVPLHAPVGIQDPFERLKRVNEQFDALQYSTKPIGFYLFFQMLGGLIGWMGKLAFETPVKSAAATLCPGPSNLNSMLGINIVDYSVAGGMPYGDVVVFGFYSFSLNGNLYLKVTGDKMLFPTAESSQRFIGLMQKELEVLNWEADNGNRVDSAEYGHY